MALHDVSKNDSMRTAIPMPNVDDLVPTGMRMAHNTTQINYTSDNDVDSSTGVKFGKGKIEIVDDNGDTRVLIGFDDGGF